MADNNSSAKCSGNCDECLEDENCGINLKDMTVTLDLDEGRKLECSIVCVYPAAGRRYIALLPLDDNGQNTSGEVYLYRYTTNNGEPGLDNIGSDDEYQAASDAFNEWLDAHSLDDLVYEEVPEDEVPEEHNSEN